MWMATKEGWKVLSGTTECHPLQPRTSRGRVVGWTEDHTQQQHRPSALTHSHIEGCAFAGFDPSQLLSSKSVSSFKCHDVAVHAVSIQFLAEAIKTHSINFNSLARSPDSVF